MKDNPTLKEMREKAYSEDNKTIEQIEQDHLSKFGYKASECGCCEDLVKKKKEEEENE